MSRASAEEIDHGAIVGWNIVRLAAGDQIVVLHDFAIDPLGARVPQIGLKRGPGGHRVPAHTAGIDQGPGCMADRGNGLAVADKAAHKFDGCRFQAQVIGIHHSAGKMQCVVVSAVSPG